MIPADTYLEKRRRKYHNGELVEIFYRTERDHRWRQHRAIPPLRCDRHGRYLRHHPYPFIDLKNGGTVQGEIDALNNILDKTGYEHDEDGGTMIIPGHGRLSDEYDVCRIPRHGRASFATAFRP